MPILAIDLGATKINGAIFNSNGDFLDKTTCMVKNNSGKEVGALICEVIDHLTYSLEENESIEAIGIGVPGIVNIKTGKVWAPNIPGWEDYPLQQEIEDHICQSSVKVNIASDRTCYILGEVWKGVANGCKNAVFISIGSGIGMGIMADGHILRGHNDIVGASGWMALDSPFMEEYKQYGCFESQASGNGIAMQARKKLQSSNYPDSLLNKIAIKNITAQDVFAAYAQSDILAIEIIDHAIRLWGMASANVVSLLNPEKVIWGGGIFGPAAQFIDRIYDEACRWAQPISIKQTKFEQSILSGNAGLLGAGYLALLEITR